MGKAKTSDRTRDVRCVAQLLRDGGYSYDQSKHLIAEARRRVRLIPPQRKKGSVERAHARGVQGSTASCLLTILAALVYWQIREIERVRGEIDPEDDGPVDLLAHISPISWDNVVLYGEYKLRPELVETGNA